MKVTTLCFRLLMLEFTLLRTQVQSNYTQKNDAAFLRITPNRLQHFQYESVSFDCGGSDGSAQLRVIRNTEESELVCGFKRTPTGSSCTIDRVYLGDSGQYWCETDGRQRSHSVNITVTAGSVILESPALPVMEGDAVTLSCRNKTTSSNLQAYFYKDGFLIKNSPTEEMAINNVSKSVEGLYKCNISGVGESPESWLAVRAKVVFIVSPSPHVETLPDDSNTLHVLILLWIAVTILMVVLVLLVVGCLQIKKCRVSSKTPTAPSHSVSEEDAADDSSGVTYAVVVTKPRENKDAADTADNLSLCLEPTHSRKPQTDKDEDESSFQPVYSSLAISENPQALRPAKSGLSCSTVTWNSTAATDPNITEPEVLYSPIQKAT